MTAAFWLALAMIAVIAVAMRSRPTHAVSKEWVADTCRRRGQVGYDGAHRED